MSDNDKEIEYAGGQGQDTSSSVMQKLKFYMLLALVIAFIVFIISFFAENLRHITLKYRLLLLIALTIGPGLGMFIGDWLRRFCMPSMIFTSDGMQGLLKAKLFWAIGPQCIGWFLGAAWASGMFDKYISG